MPPHYGVRGILWRNESFGWFADFNHTKIYADSATLGAAGTSGGFDVLQFTDGLNNLTFGPVWRFPNAWNNFSPYVAPGFGAALPHVEVQTAAASPLTFEYQFGGPSISLAMGASMPISGRTGLYGEYKGTYSMLDVDLVGGGNLQTNVITNSINVGVRIHLGRK